MKKLSVYSDTETVLKKVPASDGVSKVLMKRLKKLQLRLKLKAEPGKPKLSRETKIKLNKAFGKFSTKGKP